MTLVKANEMPIILSVDDNETNSLSPLLMGEKELAADNRDETGRFPSI